MLHTLVQEVLKNISTFLRNRILSQNHYSFYILFLSIFIFFLIYIFRFIFIYISNYLFYIFEVIKKYKFITYIFKKQIKYGKHKMYCSKKRLLLTNCK